MAEEWFPTSDEDSSTPDARLRPARPVGQPCFRPLTRIHLLLTIPTRLGLTAAHTFPTSDEDSSTPDSDEVKAQRIRTMRFRPLTRIHLLLTTLHEQDLVLSN